MPERIFESKIFTIFLLYFYEFELFFVIMFQLFFSTNR